MDPAMNSTLPSNAEGEEQFPMYFGDYEALKSIGKGKFAVVYRARKLGDENIVALKRISVDMIDDKAREKCLKEVRLLQSLDHPNIIRYMDSFICENNLMIVYEWAAAGDLKRQLRKAQERGIGFEERVIWKYFSQISNAMQHMHERRIMHRDLKPANIFLTLDGTIKVGDLGLSRELSEHTIQAHSKVGTPLYMSPEVLKGDGYDFKSDIWSLGCLLYELAMLKSPFKSEGLNLYSLFQKISNGDFQPLPETYSEELRSLVYGMISTRPQDRPEISYVCNVAQKMRTQTNDKSMRQKSKSNLLSNANTNSTSSLPPASETVNEPPPDRNRAVESGKTEPLEAKIKREDAVKEIESKKLNGIAYAEHNALVIETKDAVEIKSASKKALSKKTTNGSISSPQSREPRGGDALHISSPKLDEKARNNLEQILSPVRQLLELENGAHKSSNTQQAHLSPAKEMIKSINRAVKNGPVHPHELSHEETLPLMDALKEGLGVSKSNGYRNGYQYESSNEEKRTADNGLHSGNYMKVSSGKDGAPQSSSAPAQSRLLYAEDNRLQPAPVYESTKGDGTGVRNVSRRPKSATRSANKGRDPQPSQGESTGMPSTGRPPLEKGNSSNSINSYHGSTGPAHNLNGNRIDSAGVQKKISEGLANASPAFAVMEEVYSKLVLLTFPMHDPDIANDVRERRSCGRLLPIHFACDLNLFRGVAGHSLGYQFLQFQRFVGIVIWLCKRIGGHVEKEALKIDVDQDSPIMIAKQILRLLQAVSGSDSVGDLSDITPTSLTYGFGINVCNVLNMFSDAVLRSRQSDISEAVNGRVYPTQGLELENLGEEDDNADEDIEEVDIVTQSQLDMNNQESSGTDYFGDNPAPVLVAAVDPVLWREETERVAAQLRVGRTSGLEDGWSEHFLSFKIFARKVIGTAQAQSTGVRDQHSSQSPVDPHSATLLAPHLAEVSTSLDHHLNQIKAKERILNNIEVFQRLGLDFANIKEQLSGCEGGHNECQKSIDRLAIELAEIEEKLEECTSSLREKTGDNEQSGGNFIILKLREAIQQIKKELRDMSITETLLSSSLLRERTYALTEEAKKKRTGGRMAKSRVKQEPVIHLSDEED